MYGAESVSRYEIGDTLGLLTQTMLWFPADASRGLPDVVDARGLPRALIRVPVGTWRIESITISAPRTRINVPRRPTFAHASFLERPPGMRSPSSYWVGDAYFEQTNLASTFSVQLNLPYSFQVFTVTAPIPKDNLDSGGGLECLKVEFESNWRRVPFTIHTLLRRVPESYNKGK